MTQATPRIYDCNEQSAQLEKEAELLTIPQASEWACEHLKKKVTPSNISYLIQYGRIKKIIRQGRVFVAKQDLLQYYNSYLGNREIGWKEQLGADLNWALSFDYLKEAETTKHVHRLHPYKGKFIPQLVEYFLDEHINDFKKEAYFKKGDVILDPFCGSGTMLVQANELGMHAIGADISRFNALISNVKIRKYDLDDLRDELQKITSALKRFVFGSNTAEFENRLIQELTIFNNQYFPAPEYRYRINRHEINEDEYAKDKPEQFLPAFLRLVNEYNIKLKQEKQNTFMDKWYLQPVRTEIDFVADSIKQIPNPVTQDVIKIILSRTVRSCRATTHADLATLKQPISATYYCAKHGKMCKPLFSILGWWEHYTMDTIARLAQFNELRTNTYQVCLAGDSRTMDIFEVLAKESPAFSELAGTHRINGIFSSPPYVGLIDYHEQHAYAYDLFGFERTDELEIGPLSKGYGKESRDAYIQGISDVLNNCKKFLVDEYNIFLVANDKYNLYPIIAKKTGMQIANRYKRPVLNRTEKDKGAYSETIFHLKER